MTEAMREAWDAEADRFDDEPDHGLRDVVVRSAWLDLCTEILPPPPARVLDLGRGTGSISVLLAELGHDVLGVDLAPRMLKHAERKADRHEVAVRFQLGGAAKPKVDGAFDGAFDVVVSRHVLWALPDVPGVLCRWADLLRPDGLLVLVEGFWHTGAGWQARDLLPLVQATFERTHLGSLTTLSALWAGPVSDERYLISARTSRLGGG